MPIPTMICDYCCENILKSSKTWGKHHADIEDCEKSSQGGCVFCSRLMKHMETKGFLQRVKSGLKDQQEHLIGWPGEAVYLWTIKKLVKTREIQDCICVIFRPLPGFDGIKISASPPGRDQSLLNQVTSAEDAPTALPDVAFYFYPDQGTPSYAVNTPDIPASMLIR